MPLPSAASPVAPLKKPLAPQLTAANANLRASAPALLQQQHQYQPAAATAERTSLASTRELVSHKISVSPVAERSVTSPSSDQADTVHHSSLDTPKRSHAAGAGAFPELAAKQPHVTDASLPTTQKPLALPAAADFAAAADVVAKGGRTEAKGSDSAQKAVAVAKTPNNKLDKTPSSSKKTSAGAVKPPAGQVTPVRHMHAIHTPGKGSSPSPAVARPTCASMSRAQAVAASMHHNANGGHWKL